VRTPSDFGARSEAPSHPELLDYLAWWFMQQGWSTKKLHLLILSSRTYQQQSVDRPAARLLDPDNRLLWRMNRRRLDFEAMRDSLLAVCGQLDRQMGGRPVERALDDPNNLRRTVYTLVDREHLPNLMRVFDFPSPDLSSPERPRTTVPQQTLFFLNNRFVLARADALVARLEALNSGALEDRVQALHRWVYGRAATAEEIQLARPFLGSPMPAEPEPPEEPANAWAYGFGQISNGRLEGFQALPHFTGQAWQGGADWPDAQLHYLRLTATGGHVGLDTAHAAVRRWTAPRGGVLEITGQLSHGQETCGDGVQGWILSSRGGVLGRWAALNSKAETALAGLAVEAGETIDFVVDPQNNHSCDLFSWAPVIRMRTTGAGSTDAVRAVHWNAERDFGPGPVRAPDPLTPWAQYAQALLQSNEFQFVD
jgi:hypothetical protein